MLLHGGFRRAGAGLDLNRRQAADLAGHGWNCRNVEDRRIYDGGGWPATFDDVTAALDHLLMLDVDPAAWAPVRDALPGLVRGRLP